MFLPILSTALAALGVGGTPDVEFSLSTTTISENGGSASVVVTLSTTSATDVTVPYTVTGSAAVPADATVDPGPLVILAGQTQGTILVDGVDDLDAEGVERVVLTLGTPTGGALGANTVHEVVLEDDEPDATIEFANATLTSSEGAGTVNVDVLLSAARTEEARANFTQTGSADPAGGDVLVTPASPVVFAPGATSATLSLVLTPDALDEADEDLVLRLLIPVNAAIGATDEFTLTIEDDDDAPSVAFVAASGAAVEFDAQSSIDVELSGPSSFDVTVPITASGTADVPADATFTPATVLILAGSTTATVDVFPVDDGDVEGAETLTLSLGTPTDAVLGSQTSYDLLLVDDDGAAPTVAFDAPASSAPEEGGSVAHTVRASDYAPFTIIVPVTTSGTATDGVDYSLLTTTLTIPVGELTADVGLDVLDDMDVEGDETVSLDLGAPTGATLGSPASHVVTIVDDENADPVVDFTAATSTATEADGTVFISVALDVPAPADVTLPVLVMGTATGGGVDYTLQTSPLVIPMGSSSGTFQIDLAQDPLFEITETVVLDLDVPTGATLGTVTTHTLDLTDDDPMPTVQFTSFRFVVEEDVGTYDVDLVLSEAAGVDVSVPYTITGRASGPGDISFPAGPAVVTAGSTTGAIPITVVLDTEFEPGEVFLVALGAPDNALPGAIDSHLVLIAEVEDALSGALSDPLVPSAPTVDFPQTRVGDVSAPQTVQFANVSPRSVTVTAVAPTGPAAADFVADVVGGLPAVIGPGQNLTVDFTFEPQTYGQWSSTVGAELTFSGASPVPVALQGLSLGAPGDDLRVTCGSAGFIAPDRRFWAGDFGFAGGTVNVFAGAEVAGTDLDELYRTSRFGPAFDYAFDLPNGRYEVVVRGWEPTKTSPGERVLDVSLEGVLALDDLDYYAEVGPEAAYVSPPLMVDVTDGTLDVEVRSVVAQALVSAIDVRAVPVLSSTTSALDFGLVDQGVVETMDFVVDNGGLAPAQIDRVTFELGPIGESSDFSVTDTAATYAGATTTVSFTTDFPLLPGTNLIPITYAPSYHEDHQFTLRLESTATGDAFAVAISGTGAADASWGFLHPIPDNDPTFIVDYDSNGTEEVRLLGGESHTHEPGQTLLDFEWSINGTPAASTVDTAQPFAVGVSTVELEIGDTNVPQSRASDSRLIVVHPVAAVPGALLEYFDGSVVDEVTLLDAVPAAADFVERLDGLRVDPAGGVIGTSPFDGDVMVRMSGSFTLAAQRTLEFVATGGVGQRVLIDGGLVSGPLVLAAGAHTVEARFAVSTLTDVPAFVTVLEGGSPAFDVQGGITHDESGVAPVIHTMPTVGTDLGGNRITIEGFGFFPKDLVTVNWGTQVFTSAEFDDWTGETIVLTTPPGSGTVSVSVDTPNGTSNSVDYAYSPTGPVPVRFDLLLSKEVTISNVTSGAWGPDGKLYVSVVDGTIRIISFDDDWDVTGIDFRLGVSGLTNSDTMGVAFNPYDTYDPGDPTSIKLYVSHGEQFQNGGGPFTGPSFFTGQVTRLSGPNFDTPDPVVTQLPVSNLDHCVNGILFDDNGDLMICVGGNTNAGVKAPLLGDLPESPLSGGILRARTSSPSFNGVCLYLDSSSGVLVDDQVFGEQLDLSPGVDLEVFASGFRNSWDLMLHTNGYFYATENGPNLGYGPASLTLTTDSGSLATKPDEFNLVEKGNYYGSANRARGRYDLRQATYRSGFDPSEPEAYSAPLTLLDSSTDGLTEYRGTAFNSGLRGDVVAMKWNSGLYVIELTERGRRVGTKTLYQNTQNTTFPPNRGLDVVYGPGGALIAIDYTGGKIRVQVPDDVAAVGPTPYDITPWRVPAGGGQPFVIGGVNFGNDLGAVSVSIGGIAATVTSVSDTRIRGEIPPSPNGVPTDMLDVEVTVGAMTMTLEDALRYLPAAPGQALGTWFDDSVLPLQLGEVSSCVIDGMLYVVGQGDARTFRRDLVNHSWNFALAQRPLPGNHHGLEVVDGKIYLIGGLDNGAAGQVQIYDPALDQWSLGAQMPWDGGSCATALIDGLIYVGGGNLQAGGTAGNFAVYDPALDSWTPLGAMPTPVNHAAAGTDGARMFVFGGRQGNNVPQPGFDDVQIYDPVADTWETSDAGDVAAMPLPRGGTGRAVWLDDAFWIMGGEDASIAYEDVQVYDPVADSWRTDTPMKTPRHGIYPTVFQGRIYVLGGGLVAGFGVSAVSEVLAPR